ncbi:hypothetical protein LJB89_00505 [Tyzzerella sp. OttesenSCG-928-J15]|nr:hypothetical protein [Tyzzerella sp. OttesenSCG-928-J15]
MVINKNERHPHLLRIDTKMIDGQNYYCLLSCTDNATWNECILAPIKYIDGRAHISTEFIYQIQLAVFTGSTLIQWRESE